MIEGQRDKLKPCVGVMIWKEGKILLGKRKGSHGSGEYAFPGGHLEFDESFRECTKREILEEINIEIKNLEFMSLANFILNENRQDILVSFSAEWESGDLKIMEPEKCDGWGWYDLEDLPSPLFYPTKITIDSYKTGKNFYDMK